MITAIGGACFVAGLPRDPHRLYDRLRADTKGHDQDGITAGTVVGSSTVCTTS